MSDTTGTKSAKRDVEELLSVARKRLESAMSANSESRTNQQEDLEFTAGSPDNNYQWPDYAKTARMTGDVVDRPMLTVNKIPQYIHQVTNDQRQNRQYGNIIPANDEAHSEIAEIFEGMIRHIGYMSDADVVYDTACESIGIHGEGYFRIITKFSDEDSFDQDAELERIQNPFNVYMDPTIKKQCGEDADWCFILEDLIHDDYERQFPDASPISSLQEMGNGDQGISSWLGEKTIRIAEYFFKKKRTETLNLYPDDHTAFEGTPEDDVYSKFYKKPVKSRKSERVTIKWVKTNGCEVLEETDWAGKYIPIIRVIGNEFIIKGQRHISGLVRNMKDSQRMYNYHASNEVEMIALSPKVPFILAAGQVDGFEKDWQTANVKNHPYLQYNPVVDEATGDVLPPPQRVQPPMIQSGIIAAKNAASQDMKEVTGLYNASLGEQGNERSGKAIMARQHEGDVGTFHYVDNLSRAIRYGTRQLIDLIPKIYDTKRIARVLGEDNSSSTATLDSSQVGPDGKPTPVTKVVNQDGSISKIYNPSVGKYDVIAVTGPGYATARREAADSMSRILESNPDLWNKIGDLAVEEMDWPGAQKIAKRLAKGMPPQLTAADDDNPALQQAQQHIQQVEQELQQAHGMLQNIQNSIEAKELAIKQYDAETKRMAVISAAQTAAAADTAAGMTEEQVQESVMGTIHSMMASGHLMGADPSQQPQPPQEASPTVDQTKLMQEQSKHVLQANQHNQDATMQVNQQAHEADMQANAPQPAPGGQ